MRRRKNGSMYVSRSWNPLWALMIRHCWQVLNALKQNDKKEKEAPVQGYSSAKFDTEVAPKLNDGGVVVSDNL